MRIISLIIIFLILSFGTSFGETSEVQVYPRVSYYASLFNKALARERIGAYDDALYAYGLILSYAQTVLNSKPPYQTVERILPYMIAAAYRKGIVTHRSIEGSVVKLYKQLQMYEETDKWINEVFAQISNLELDRGIILPKEQYGVLYFARAYNKAGWAFALFNGSIWKRYIIYMPADVIVMLDKSIEDLKQTLSMYDINYQVDNIDEKLRSYFSAIDVSSPQYLTLDLCYNAEGPEVLRKIISKQFINNIKGTIDLYYSAEIQRSLENGKKILTFEDLINKPETREVSQALLNILESLKGK